MPHALPGVRHGPREQAVSAALAALWPWLVLLGVPATAWLLVEHLGARRRRDEGEAMLVGAATALTLLGALVWTLVAVVALLGG